MTSVFVRLFDRLDCSKSQIYSPFSLEAALVVPYVGSDLETKDVLAAEFNKVIPKGSSPIDFYEKLNSYLTDTSVVSMANAIWVNNKSSFKLNERFQKTVERVSSIQIIAFDEKFQDTVDGFISGKTKGMIPNGPKIDCSNPHLTTVIVNTLLFQGKWKVAFPFSWEGDFTLSNGEVIKHPLMSNKMECKYYKDKNMQVIELEYLNGFSMLVFLARDSLELCDVSEAKITGVREEMKIRTVEVILPKFTAQSTISLLKPLIELTSDKIRGNYNLIGSEPLSISAIVQQCKIEVDESGTKAAAAMSVFCETNCIDRRIFFYADRPFSYTIIDTTYQKQLFKGSYLGK
ncbi:MAG: hypothetical protein Harvfovirus66_4 [Harvfovirus sp.]|uniref:Serpin domain-containing protein n=1 Tax=Harvfovirus sp. TaxID=2487768 RepID=A0A3G5A7L4_9VIRU|nr:MAG: hypothetical protein Harvfovirus66_4 [Harvfovirus sp.]